ncbi:MAG: hypothetical protein ABGX83_05435 [Nitrospira sp.]
METQTESKAWVRRDLIEEGLSMPVGEKYYGGTEPLLCRWINDEGEVDLDGANFQVFFEGSWEEALSIDFVFSKPEEGDGTFREPCGCTEANVLDGNHNACLEAQHTHGPWAFKERTGPYRYQIFLPRFEDHNTIAEVNEAGWLGEETIMANARLIASAPDLLEALVGLVDNPGLTWLPGMEVELHEAMKTARRVIAQATGEGK